MEEAGEVGARERRAEGRNTLTKPRPYLGVVCRHKELVNVENADPARIATHTHTHTHTRTRTHTHAHIRNRGLASPPVCLCLSRQMHPVYSIQAQLQAHSSRTNQNNAPHLKGTLHMSDSETEVKADDAPTDLSNSDVVTKYKSAAAIANKVAPVASSLSRCSVLARRASSASCQLLGGFSPPSSVSPSFYTAVAPVAPPSGSSLPCSFFMVRRWRA